MTKKTSWIIGSVILIIIVVAAGSYAYFSTPVAAPSRDITATNTQLAQNSSDSSSVTTSSGVAMTETFQIDSTRSNATFRIFEVLRGEDFTVVGTTNQIAGNIIVDRANVAASSASEILVNARTLKIDSAQRDGAIARMILKSENAENEFIRFVPSAIIGLPATGVEGTAYPVQITGNLTVSGVTKTVTFDSSVTYTAENTLQISAKTIIKRADFNLIVPDLPFLADVSEDVEIDLTLVATPTA